VREEGEGGREAGRERGEEREKRECEREIEGGGTKIMGKTKKVSTL
jgi:hypothetical protein